MKVLAFIGRARYVGRAGRAAWPGSAVSEGKPSPALRAKVWAATKWPYPHSHLPRHPAGYNRLIALPLIRMGDNPTRLFQ